jgi:polyhydroxybutyrate depolymerase
VDAGGPANGSQGCGRTNQATGDFHLQATDGAGKTRDYEVIVPSSYDPSIPMTLTFAYHGAGGDESAAKSYGFQNLAAAAKNSIFVFPQGIQYQDYGVGWDDTCGGYDVVFFDNMLASIEASYCIDPARVFAAGFSWGCDQATALLCCRGNKLRAIAAASCTDEYTNASDYTTYANWPCPTHGTVGVRFTHDSSGGDSAYPKPLFTTTSTLFQVLNGCATTASAPGSDNCRTFDNCASPYVECAYPNLGHSAPSNWAQDSWAFFASFK